MYPKLSFLKTRMALALSVIALLAWAWSETATVRAGQAARSQSRPDQDDLTFWAHHEGLIDLHLEGEVGFGDLARLAMRRRSNAALMRQLRDRFTFPDEDIARIQTPDVFRLTLTGSGIVWDHRPEQFVIGENRIFNLPVVVANRSGRAVEVEARFAPGSGFAALESSFPAATLEADKTAAYYLEVLETEAGAGKGRLSVQAGGESLETEVSFDVRPLVPLRVRLIDDDGSPAAARVYLTGSDGLAYTPNGHISRITAMSAEYYFHAENSFEIELPSGRTLIEASRGLEYELSSQAVNLEPGKPREISLRLKRWENMAAAGWYSSDAHIHANYTAPHHQTISPADARLDALGEDLNNANLMVANSSSSFLHDLRHFEGKPHALSGPNHILYFNEEMRNSGPYGHMCFYGLKRLVSPLYTGFAGTPFWEDYPPNYTQAKDAQDQGGAVTYAHPISGGAIRGTSPRLEPLGRLYPPIAATTYENASVGELPVDLALGQIDALDVFSNSDEIGTMEIWYGLLNCGFRLAVSAGSDAFTNVVDHYTPGGGRVYVHAGRRLDYGEWVRAFKRGRSFASNGPMLSFTVNGKEAGEEIRLAKDAARVRVSARVRTQIPIERIEVVANGEVVASRDATRNRAAGGDVVIREAVGSDAAGVTEIVLDEEIQLERSSWIALRAYGPWHRLVLNDLQTFAHTSPVYVVVDGQPIAARKDLRFYIDWVEKLIARVKDRGRFASEARRQEVVELFTKALDEYRRRESAIPAE
ncbi:MAG: CehA/McbA family metallohydrolase [Bryobacterales bacterium]